MNETMGKQAADNASSLASEIADVENRLRDMGKLRAATAAHQSAAGRAAGEMSAVRAQRIAAESSIETLTDRQFVLEQQLGEQKRQIQEQQKIVKLAPSDAKASSSYGCSWCAKPARRQLKNTAPYTAKSKSDSARRTWRSSSDRAAHGGGDQSHHCHSARPVSFAPCSANWFASN